MDKNKIAVVILHYNDFKMTKEYIDSLKKLEWNNIEHKFIIVDNCSPDNSGKNLFEFYQSDEEVKIILLEKNIGFARGKNIGILYARQQLNYNLIVVSNNDIAIKSEIFPQKLIEEYENSGFAVYGPDIYSLSKTMHQSPMRKDPMNLEQVQKQIEKIDRILPILKILDKLKIYDFLKKIKGILSSDKENQNKEYLTRHEDYVLHGSFFVLSELYLNEYPEGLFDKTFLYMEEDILAFRCKLKNLKTIYDPTLKIIHYDGVSSLKISGNRCKKFIREMTETRKSCVEYMNYMKEELQ